MPARKFNKSTVAAVSVRRDDWLNHLSQQHTRHAVAQEALVDWAIVWLARILTVAVLYFIMVNLMPLVGKSADGESAGGNALRQAIYLGFAGLASILILARWQRVVAVLPSLWSLLLVFAAMALSVFWSEYPDVSIRRIAVYAIVFVIALGIGATLNRPKLFLPPAIVAFFIIIVANLLFTVAAPGQAWTPIGLQAMFPSKNAAGMGIQAMTIALVCGLLAIRHPLWFLATAFTALLSLGFLILTLSKTATGITVLCIAVLVPVFYAIAALRIMSAFTLIGFAVLVGLITFATGALSLSGADWAGVLTGDPTLSARDQLWVAGVQHIAKSPILGYGYGAQWSMLPLYHPLWDYTGFWSGQQSEYIILTQFHNGYLDLMVHGGLVLSGAVAIFLLDAFQRSFRPLIDVKERNWSVAGAVMFPVFLVAMLISNMLESSLFFPDMSLGQLLIILFVANAFWRQTAEQNRRRR